MKTKRFKEDKHQAVQKNDLVTLLITDLSEDGSGIGRVETAADTPHGGYTLFVKGALIGERVEALVMKTKARYGYARLMKILEASPDRIPPACPYVPACGGCQLMHMDYRAQLQYKQQKVAGILSRIGGIMDYEMLPIIGMEDPYHYRNKAQFPAAADKSGRVCMGFYAGHSHRLIDLDACLIQDPDCVRVMDTVRRWMNDKKIRPYDEVSGKGLVRHVLVRTGKATGQVMACLIINGRTLPESSSLVEMLRKIPGMTSVSININMVRTNVILGDETKTLWGKDYIEDCIGDVTFRISPQSFYQVNPSQTHRLYAQALDFAAPGPGETVWDLYCGIGTISLFLARQASRVYGVEIVPQAVADARLNAQLNHITNAEFFEGKAEEVLPAMRRERGVSADIIVVDPPRAGCDQALLSCMAEMEPGRIVYVSCDPATLARDLKYLEATGKYRVEKVRCVDMFGFSGHVETVVLMSRVDR